LAAASRGHDDGIVLVPSAAGGGGVGVQIDAGHRFLDEPDVVRQQSPLVPHDVRVPMFESDVQERRLEDVSPGSRTYSPADGLSQGDRER
jgi:hypothetical protein